MKSLVIALLCCLVALASGHPASVPSARIKVAADRSYVMSIRFDLLAFALEQLPSEVADGPMNALLDGPIGDLEARLAEARQRFREGLKLEVDGSHVELADFDFPTARQVIEIARSTGKQRLPVMVTIDVKGRFSSSARAFGWRFPEGLGTVVYTIEFPYVEPLTEPVEAGQISASRSIPTPQEATRSKQEALAPPTAAKVAPPIRKPPPVLTAKKAPPVVTVSTAITVPAPIVGRPDPGPSPIVAFGRYLKLGYRHILPEGLDHILFVIGLFLLSTRMRDLVKLITAFTISHSLTLALAMYGWVRLPSSIVEPLIAASIAFVAIENLASKEMKAWRPYVVFGFGLVHGLGFASGLKDLGLAKGDFLQALVGFNVGVELGQLSVVVAAFLVVGWWRSNERYRAYVVMPASAAIAMIAVFWTIQRILAV